MSRRNLAFAASLALLAVLAVVVAKAVESGRSPLRGAPDKTGRFLLSGAEAYDRKTGLIWRRCMVGRTWEGGKCAGRQRLMTWFDAMAMKDGGWRVPSQSELQSLYQERPGHPKINLEAFPDATENQQLYYWSSNKLDSCLENGNRACAEVVGFNGDGAAYSPFGGYPGIFHMPVRLVRNSAPAASAVPAASSAEPTTVDGRWVLHGDEAVDQTTGLVWRRCNAAQTWSAGLGCRGVVRGYTFDEATALQGKGWRLPTNKEIETIYYHGRVASGMPLLDPRVFQDVDPNHATYWTASPATDCPHCTQSLCGDVCYVDATGARVAKFAFCGNFGIGWNAMTCDKRQSKLVRLVRSAR